MDWGLADSLDPPILLGKWSVRAVSTTQRKNTLGYFATKHRQMAMEADVGFMIWDAKSAGTLLNVIRLVSENKKVVVYSIAAKRFVKIRKEEDFDRLLATCSAEACRKIARQLATEKPDGPSDRQASLL